MSDENGNGAASKDPSITITLSGADMAMGVQHHNCTADVALMMLERAARNIEHGWRVEKTQATMDASIDAARARALAQDVMRRH